MTLSTSQPASVPSISYAAAIERATAEEMRRDETVIYMATNPPPALVAEFGATRVRRTPISESAVTGMCIGAAGSGLRPIAHWANATFGFVAFDQVVNQAAKIRYMFGGQQDFPIVLRALSGGGLRLAAQHSQSPYAIYAHIPGLKIILPATPEDARGLMTSAIRDNNPVISFEPARLATEEGPINDDGASIPLGVASTPRSGDHVTIVALGYMVKLALEAADHLATDGIGAEVIDPRTIVPLDLETIRASVLRTRRLVVVDEAPAMCSVASEIVARICSDADTFAQLQHAPVTVNGHGVPIPYSPVLEDFVLPSTDRIVAAARRALGAE